ncbi:DUF3018 family protein [Burkholderia pseudomallei]|nr:DUF3018 family protein [Burkholderia pseudomallei]RIV73074.1 DUF3018 family protein [Burkholderia pseudomallei]
MPSMKEPANKVSRYRNRMRAAWYRPAQFRVLDTDSPEFAATLRSQCRSLHGDPAEADAIGFGETAAGLIESWE